MLLKISEIKPNPQNPRTIKDENFKKLVQSIKDFPEMLDARPLVINKDNIILGGNMRFKASKEAGLKEVPVKIVDWSEEKQREFIIKDNISGGDWDWDQLANEWDVEQLDEWGLDVPDFAGDVEVEEDEAPDVSQEPPKSELGKVYQLGRHRVMCGDSTDAGSVAILMDGNKADMVFTDPPYGINLETDLSSIKTDWKGWKGKGGKYSKVIGDDKNYNSSHLFSMFPDVKEMFIWGANYFIDTIPNFGKDGSWIVWDKKTNQKEETELSWKMGAEFELCWSKNKHKQIVIRQLWQGLYGTESQDIRSREHPTQKPLQVLSPIIIDYTEEGSLVIDLFLGSGSTLIACEQTNRTCYGMELDPKYVDVIRKRYAKFVYPDKWEEEWESLTPEAE